MNVIKLGVEKNTDKNDIIRGIIYKKDGLQCK